MQNIGQVLLASLNAALLAVATFIPKFIAGLVILLLGIIIASILKQLIVGLFKTINVEGFLRRYNVPEGKNEFTWTNIIAEIIRWFVIIIFLIPTAEIWGIPQLNTVLQQFILYIPNVIVAVIIGMVGFVLARIAYDVVIASTRGISADASRTLALVTRWAVTVFTILAVLTQLGVAADLVRILFTGFVAMVAIAGGIAFGLGGQRTASDMLDAVRKSLSGSTTKRETVEATKKTSKK